MSASDLDHGLPPLALTMGEPAGIGGEITLAAWARERHALSPFFVVDDPARLDRLARRIDCRIPIVAIDRPADARQVFDTALPVLPLKLSRAVEPGRPDPANAPAVIESIDRAVALVQGCDAAAVVTNPINKKCLYDAGFRHPGHTEYLAQLAGPGIEPVMMLVGGGLRVVPVTIHLSLRAAIERVTTARVVAQADIAAKALRRDFGIAAPALAVAGLNPHAGEAGSLGREEIEVIAPAVAELRRHGHAVDGPLAPDTLFHRAARARYDAVICMYHDQALIPLKTLAFESGVNVTLGLPFIRTSPDHGTAFDIAGAGRADPTSLIAAIRLAAELAANRARAGRARVPA